MLTKKQARNQARLFGRYVASMNLDVQFRPDDAGLETVLVNRLWKHALRYLDWTSILEPYERDDYHGCFDEGPLSLEEAFVAWRAGLLGLETTVAA